jgi:chitin disaccharide deacetylase
VTTAMRYLIVNADDLGAAPGITRGILECHARGIVTSTSLMVETPWSAEAAALARPITRLSVGLHVDLARGEDAPNGAAGHGEACVAIRRQYDRFVALMGQPPTHIDSHHNVHRDPRLIGTFLAFSRGVGLPLRGHSPARYVSSFYGRWGGESHPEHVSVESLLGMIEREAGVGFTEFGCHPGTVDPRLATDYAGEREVELATLCDRRVPAALAAMGIALASFHDLDRLAAPGRADADRAGRRAG